jgi:protein arginine kinase activator
MICDRCKKNEAAVHVESIVNGKRTEHNLCFECAAAMNPLMNAEASFENIIKEFLSSVIDHTGAHAGEDRPGRGPVCPRCGMTFEDFKAEGKLGCAQCYAAFRPQLDGVLKSIHGSGEHLGKISQKAPPELTLKRELGELRRRLKEAVENEEFETAAKLRDRIRDREEERKGAEPG